MEGFLCSSREYDAVDAKAKKNLVLKRGDNYETVVEA
jgi:hypothetical protein